MATTLYVGHLPLGTTEVDVRDLFQKTGNVLRCTVVTDPSMGVMYGFAFVEMTSRGEALNAIRQFDDRSLEGRGLIVHEVPPGEECFAEEDFLGSSSVRGGISD